MTVLDFPSALLGRAAALNWHLLANTQTFVSPLSRATQSAELPGAVWTAQMQLPTMTEVRWRAFTAWLVQLRGAAGRFYFSPPHALLPAGGAVAGSPTVTQVPTRTSLRIAGLPANAVPLRAGDLFHVVTGTATRELKILTQDAETNASGAVTAFFEPPLRRLPAVGAAIVCNYPTCVMRLTDDEQGALALAAGPKGRATLNMVEAIP